MSGQRFKTLLVEDNPGEARLFQELLAAETGTGDLFDVECADRLATGIRCLADGDIDVILLDLSLPDSQGDETFAKMRAYAPDIPIVVLSGLENEAVAFKMVKGGAQDYLPKAQVNANLLARTIRYAIERKRAEQELKTEIEGRKRVEEVLRQSERALSDKNTELQNALNAKIRFLANMSHELRTPLNGIIGFAEFLMDGKPGTLNPKQKEYLEDILNSGKHLLELISDVLDLVKVGVGEMVLNPEQISLRKTIEEVCAVAKPIADKKSIHIAVDVAPKLGDVKLDRQKFKQILSNLLFNAIKFNHDGGKVEILVTPHGAHRFTLEVKDTGIGIKGEDLQRIFQEFEQVDSGTTRRYEGTGLGLALIRKIVELQDGTISVESEIGKGSTFMVVLPLVVAAK